MVFIVQVISLREGNSVVKDLLGRLCHLLSSDGDLGIEVIGNCLLTNLRNDVCGNAPGLNSYNPVVE